LRPMYMSVIVLSFHHRQDCFRYSRIGFTIISTGDLKNYRCKWKTGFFYMFQSNQVLGPLIYWNTFLVRWIIPNSLRFSMDNCDAGRFCPTEIRESVASRDFRDENLETKVDPLRFRLIRIENPGRQRVYICTLSLRSFALCCYRTRKISADPRNDVGKVYNDYRPTWIGESYYFEAGCRRLDAAGRNSDRLGGLTGRIQNVSANFLPYA
jgi:hypothetical protein